MYRFPQSPAPGWWRRHQKGGDGWKRLLGEVFEKPPAPCQAMFEHQSTLEEEEEELASNLQLNGISVGCGIKNWNSTTQLWLVAVIVVWELQVKPIWKQLLGRSRKILSSVASSAPTVWLWYSRKWLAISIISRIWPGTSCDYHHFLCHCYSAEQPIQLLMELVSAFSRRRDLSMLHAFFCAVTCCLGKSLSHYLSLHLLFLLFCEKPCSHFWGKAIQIQRLPKKHQELQPFSPSAISQLPNFQKTPRTWRPKTCRQRNGHTALDLLHLWLRSRLENLSRVNRAIRAKPQELFFLKSAMWENDATFPGTVVFSCWGVFL